MVFTKSEYISDYAHFLGINDKRGSCFQICFNLNSSFKQSLSIISPVETSVHDKQTDDLARSDGCA